MTVIIEGHLTTAGRKTTEVIKQSALVTLTVGIGPGYPAEARIRFGDEHRKAEIVADAARKGALVRIEAEGFFPRLDHSTAAVVLTNVRSAWIDGTPVYP